MPSLAKHQSNEFTKILVTGDSKSGKSGALASLVMAGYKLRILDFDNGLDILKQYVLRDCPEKIDNIEYRTLRDERTSGAEGPKISGKPKAFITSYKMLDNWKYDDVDYGVPSEWGPECILVIDSLTFMSDAAFDFHEAASPDTKSGKHDIRAVYGSAQGAIEHVLAFITGPNFKTNVIVISHVKYVDNPDGTKKGYPVSIGSAISPTIPRYWNNYIRFSRSGGKRKIETESSAMFDLATAAPFHMESKFDIETGMADVFRILRGPGPDEIVKPVAKLRKV